jgi:hypothetical protein
MKGRRRGQRKVTAAELAELFRVAECIADAFGAKWRLAADQREEICAVALERGLRWLPSYKARLATLGGYFWVVMYRPALRAVKRLCSPLSIGEARLDMLLSDHLTPLEDVEHVLHSRCVSPEQWLIDAQLSAEVRARIAELTPGEPDIGLALDEHCGVGNRYRRKRCLRRLRGDKRLRAIHEATF